MVLHNWLRKVLCCGILQLVCTHQRNVTPRSNAIKRVQSTWESDYFVLAAVPSSVFTFLFSFFFTFLFSFHFPNSPLSPALNFAPHLFLFTCFRDAASSSFLSLIAASTEGVLWAHFLRVGPGWPPAPELCLHPNFCLAPWWHLESAHCSRSPGECSWETPATLRSHLKRSIFEAWAKQKLHTSLTEDGRCACGCLSRMVEILEPFSKIAVRFFK